MDFKEYSTSFLHFYTGEIPVLLEKYLSPAGIASELALADLGCGDGALLVALYHKGHLKRARRVIGIDLSPERIKRLRSCSRFEAICSDVSRVPDITDNSINFIICTQVIEHVPDDRILAQEMYRQLQSGGTAYVASVVKKWYGWFYYRTKHGKWACDPTHEREYASKEQFESLIQKAGFEIRETKMTLYKLSVVEFFIRRIAIRIFTMNDINSFFIRHGYLNALRKLLKIPVPGYYIIETIAQKNRYYRDNFPKLIN